MVSLELMDAVSVQDVYVSGAVFEDAGEGMMRIIRYVTHQGVRVPVFSYVTSAASMIRDGTAAVEFARKMLRDQFIGSH